MFKLFFATGNDYRRVHTGLEQALTAHEWEMFTTEPSGSGHLVTADLAIARKILEIAKNLQVEVVPRSVADDQPTRAQLVADALALLKAPDPPRSEPKPPLSVGEGLAIAGIVLAGILLQVAVFVGANVYFSNNPLAWANPLPSANNQAIKQGLSTWTGQLVLFGEIMLFLATFIVGTVLVKKIINRNRI